MTRRCFLHVGTHKTGTSSIQQVLDHHRADLSTHGFLYPRAGIVPGMSGHHNIAWELAGSGDHRREYGTIDDLVTEIGHSTQDVVLSSEDFTIAFARLTDFRSFIERLKRCGLRTAIVIYFRNPPDYFRSAYFQILTAGCPVGFAPFISAMAEDRIVRWDGHAAGGVDVVRSLQELATDEAIDVIARSYDKAKTSIVADFLSVIGLTLADLRLVTETRENERATIGDAFAMFYRNRRGRPPDAHEAWLIARLAEALAGADVHMSDGARRMLQAKHEYQRRVLRQYGLDEPELGTEPGPSSAASDGAPCLEDVFSETTARFVEATARKLAAGDAPPSGS